MLLTKNWQKNARQRLFTEEERARMGIRDWLIMIALTAVYAVVAFTNLGSLDVPKTHYSMNAAGNSITVRFKQPETIESIKYYTALGDGDLTFYYSADGMNYTQVTTRKDTGEQDEEGNPVYTYSPLVANHTAIDIYEWQFLDCAPFEAEYVSVHVDTPGIQMLEIGFCGSDGLPVPIASVKDSDPDAMPANPASNMFDEQDHVPQRTYFMTEMYFDEVYHARTALEYIEHVTPYEITHPPLGKTIITLGIRIFGMDPFGWRFMGTLFGVLLLPLMYYFAKKLFKKPLFAFIPMFLYAVDFMHFTQTRMATVDSYSSFFVILMYLFMYIYSERNYNKEPLMSTLLPLALCGVFFGVGASTKWLCLYSSAGLIAILGIQFYKRHREFSYARLALSESGADAPAGDARAYLESISRGYVKKTLITVLWCVMFFVIVPLVIYYFSYAPYMARPSGAGGAALRIFFFAFAAAVIISLFTIRFVIIRRERNAARKRRESRADDENLGIRRRYLQKTVLTVMLMLFVLAAVGLFIYYSSFTLYTAQDQGPYDLSKVLGNQEYMFKYHAYLKTAKPHPFESRWWSWPLDIRPVFLFQGKGYPQGMMSSLSTMGNPAVWWGGLAAVVALIAIRISKGRLGRRTMFIGIAAASQYLPWVLVTRETFIYHYFETVPFLILLMAVLAKYMIERTRHGRFFVFVFLGVCLLLFILFYPVTTGIEIPKDYANIIRWLPTWPFY